MKTITINVYSFDELSDVAKNKALQHYRSINVDYEWWEFTYEDAKNIGLKITAFDLDRGRHAEGEFINDASEVADKILKEHGDNCQTYKTAQRYIEELKEIELKYKGKDSDDDNYYLDKEISELDSEFLNNLLEDYSIMLQNEFDYLQSDEGVAETLKANDYEFTEEGNAYHE